MVDNTGGFPRAGGHDLKIAGASSSTNVTKDDEGSFKQQDQLLPIANVGRIMKQILPPKARISKEAKETMQECVSEFISFVTGEASDKCHKEKRKTINSDDIFWVGIDEYVDPLKRYLHKYRDAEGETHNQNKSSKAADIDGNPPF